MKLSLVILLCCVALRCFSAAQFDGVNQYARSDSSINLSASPKLTVALWFFAPTFDNSNGWMMSSTADSSTTAGSFTLAHNDSGGSFSVRCRGNAGTSQKTFPRPSSNSWHHLVFQADMSLAAGSEIVGVWIDAKPQTLTTIASFENTSNFADANIYLAARGTLAPAQFGEVTLDNVSIWGGALLGLTDIKWLYESRTNSHAASVQAGSLKVSWKLDEVGAGGTFSGAGQLLDQSGNGETATAFNLPAGITSRAFSPLTTVLAASTSLADVQAAANNWLPGDTLLIPAGSNTWSGEFLANHSGVIRGTMAGTNKLTIIKDAAADPDTGLIDISGLSFPRLFRMRDLKIYADNSLSSFAAIHVQGSPTNTGFRVDHVEFRNLKKRALWTQGIYGLTDTCYAEAPTDGTAQTIRIDGDMYNGITRDTNDTTSSWQRPLALGSTNYVYVQDWTNNFSFANDGPGDSYFGGRRVDRDNLYINGTWGVHGCDSGWRGAHSYEFYRNRMVVTSAAALVAGLIDLRGGTGVIWDNSFEALTFTYTSGRITVQAYRATGTHVYPLGLSMGMITGTNIIDGNITNGWPSLDQVGVTSPTTFLPTNSVQTLSPLYQWNNTLVSPAGTTNVVIISVGNVYGDVSPNAADILKVNRDFFNSAHPSYTPLGDHPFEVTTLDISPGSATVAALATQLFTGTGGSGHYVYFELLSDTSGGAIDSTTGLYTAGPIPGTALARVWDSNGDSADSSITISSGGPPITTTFNVKIWKFLGL